jgi:hypothetical protein
MFLSCYFKMAIFLSSMLRYKALGMEGRVVRAIAATLLIHAVGWCGIVCAAEPLPLPAGPVLLTVAGAIRQTNAPGEARFDQAMLDALGLAKISTTTPWTDGVKVFEGVRLRAVLDRVGAQGTQLVASALNDFEAVIPVDDLQYEPILATRKDGEPLRRADMGPLWIIYPRDEHPTLMDPNYEQRWVWQLKRLEVR